MLQIGPVRPLPVRRSHQRGVAVTIVVALHAVVITAFLVSLRPSLGPTPIHWTRVFIPKATPSIEQPSVPPKPTFVRPTVLSRPVLPDFTVENTNEHSSILPSSPGATGAFIQSFVPARPIFGTHTIPPYPPLATRLGHEGNVTLHVAIDPNGIVTNAQIIRSSGFAELDEAAADWVCAHWRYRPAERNGAPAGSAADITVTFRLTAH